MSRRRLAVKPAASSENREAFTSVGDLEPISQDRACRRMWRCMIAVLILDSFRMPKPLTIKLASGPVDCTEERERKAAIRWFQDGGEDFRLACELADLDPRMVRAGWLRAMAAVEQVPLRRGSKAWLSAALKEATGSDAVTPL